MNKVYLALRSRTVWTVAIIVAINIVPQLKGLVSQGVLDTLNGVLLALAAYFRVNPSADYTQS